MAFGRDDKTTGEGTAPEPQEGYPREGEDGPEIPGDTPPGVADRDENADLEHSSGEGGPTTRSDATDVGVPMLPGDGSESQGPEDALGDGPKRGDYADRVGEAGYQPTQTRRVEDAEPGEPHTEVVAQRPNASDQGEVPGEKGGVTTSADSEAV